MKLIIFALLSGISQAQYISPTFTKTASGGNNISHVRTFDACSGSSAVTTFVCTLKVATVNTDPTVGNVLMIACIVGDAATTSVATFSAPSDNQSGNSYTNVAGATGSQSTPRSTSLGVYWSKVVGASGTFTWTCNWSGVTAFPTVLIDEYSSVNATPVDTSGKAGSTGTAMSPGAITTGNANDLLYSVCGNTNNSSGTATFTPNTSAPNNFVLRANQADDSNFMTGAAADQLVSATNTYTGSITYSISSGTQSYFCGVVAMKST